MIYKKSCCHPMSPKNDLSITALTNRLMQWSTIIEWSCNLFVLVLFSTVVLWVVDISTANESRHWELGDMLRIKWSWVQIPPLPKTTTFWGIYGYFSSFCHVSAKCEAVFNILLLVTPSSYVRVEYSLKNFDQQTRKTSHHETPAVGPNGLIRRPVCHSS